MKINLFLSVILLSINSGICQYNDSNMRNNNEHNTIISYEIAYIGNPRDEYSNSLKFSSSFDPNMKLFQLINTSKISKITLANKKFGTNLTFNHLVKSYD